MNLTPRQIVEAVCQSLSALTRPAEATERKHGKAMRLLAQFERSIGISPDPSVLITARVQHVTMAASESVLDVLEHPLEEDTRDSIGMEELSKYAEKVSASLRKLEEFGGILRNAGLLTETPNSSNES